MHFRQPAVQLRLELLRRQVQHADRRRAEDVHAAQPDVPHFGQHVYDRRRLLLELLQRRLLLEHALLLHANR